jgi:hypothetical protein
MRNYKDFKMFSKDQAYWERNQLVCALSKIYPSSIGKHNSTDKSWDKDWMNIVYITIPVKCNNNFPVAMDYIVKPMQISWHIHKSELPMFKHLKRSKDKWDGHTTEEKYKRLSFLHIQLPPSK